MKKTLTLMALLGAAPLAMAYTETLLEVDLTSTNKANMEAADWTFSGWRSAGGTVSFDANGVKSGGWNQSAIFHDFTLDLTADPTATYVIDYTLHSTNNKNYNNLLVLAGNNGSLVFGRSYQDDTTFHAGVKTGDAFAADGLGTEANLPQIAGDNKNCNDLTALTTTGTAPAYDAQNADINYNITLTGTSMTVVISGAGNTITNTYSLTGDDFSYQTFSKIGFVLDSGNSYAKNLTVSQVFDGDLPVKTWNATEGAPSVNWADASLGLSNHMGTFTANVTATEAADDKATIVIGEAGTEKYVVIDNLVVNNGKMGMDVASGSTLTIAAATTSNSGSYVFSGAGDVKVSADGLTADSINGLTGTFELAGAHTMTAGGTKASEVALTVSDLKLTGGAQLTLYSNGATFNNKFTLNGGTVYIEDGENTVFNFHGGIEAGSQGAAITSQYDKNVTISSQVTGNGVLKLQTTNATAWGRAKFTLTGAIANSVTLEVNDAILNIGAGASFGSGTSVGTLKLVSTDITYNTPHNGDTATKTATVNLNANTSFKLDGASQGVINVNGKQLGLSITSTTNEDLIVTGAGTIDLTIGAAHDLTGSASADKQWTFTGTLNITQTGNAGIAGGEGAQLFKKDANDHYANLNFVSSSSVFGIGANYTYDNALNIGDLSGNTSIQGDWGGGNNIHRYISVHQTSAETTFSGAFKTASNDRQVGLIKNGTGNLKLTGNNTTTARLEVNSGSVTLADGGAWAGKAIVANGATLAYENGSYGLTDASKYEFQTGSTLEVKDGTHADLNASGLTLANMTLGSKPNVGMTVSVYQDTTMSGTLTMTKADSGIGFINGKSLSIAGGAVKATATTNQSDIKSTGAATVTSTAAGSAITFKNMDLAFNHADTETAYDFASAVSGTTNVTKTGEGTVKMAGCTLKNVTVSAGTLEVGGTSTIESASVTGALTNATGGSVTIAGGTLNGAGNLHNSSETLTISAKTAATTAEGTGTAAPSVSNITISDDGIAGVAGSEASIDGAQITIENAGVSLSDVVLNNTVLVNNSDADLNLKNVTFGEGSAVAGPTILTLSAADVKLDGKVADEALTITYTGLNDTAILGAFKLELGEDLMVALQKTYYNTPFNTLHVDLGETVLDGIDDLTVTVGGGFPALNTATVEDSTITVTFADYVPEPTTGALSLLALAALAARRRRKH